MTSDAAVAVTTRLAHILRQVHEILNTDLADVDLVALKSSQDTKQFVRVLEAVAPLLDSLTKEHAFVVRYVKRQVTGGALLFALVLLFTLAVAGAMCWLVRLKYVETGHAPEQRWFVLGTVIITFMPVLWLLTNWMHGIRARTATFKHLRDTDNTLKAVKGVDVRLAQRFIVKYAIFTLQGRDAETLKYMSKPRNASIACAMNGWIDGNDASCNIPGFNPCNPPEMQPSLENVAWTFNTNSGATAPCADHSAASNAEVLDELQKLKLDVDAYEPWALWRCVAAGVESVRRLVHASFDEQAGVHVQSTSIEAVVDAEVMPLLRLEALEPRGVALRDIAAGPAGGEASTAVSKTACWRKCLEAGDACKLAYYTNNTTCYIAGRLDDLKPAHAYDTGELRDKHLLVRRGTDATVVCGRVGADTLERAGAQPEAIGGATSAATRDTCVADPTCMLFKNGALPDALDLVAQAANEAAVEAAAPATPASAHIETLYGRGRRSTEGAPPRALEGLRWRVRPEETFLSFFEGDPATDAEEFCMRATADQLYASGFVRAPALLRENATYLGRRIAEVVMASGNGGRIESQAGRIKAEVARFYRAGEGQPDETPTRADLDAAVDAVLHVAAKSLRSRRARAAAAPEPGKPVFVDPHRFAAKLAALPADAWQGLSERIARATRCALQHRLRFAGDMTEPPGVGKTHIALWYGLLGGLIALTLGTLVVRERRRAAGPDMSLWQAMRQCIVLVCVYMMACGVVSILASKHIARLRHNVQVSRDNTSALVSALHALTQQACSGRVPEAWSPKANECTTPSKPTGATDTHRMYTAMTRVVQYFDRCNDFGIPKAAPFPWAELLVFVIAAAIFLTMAAIALGKLDPAERLRSVKRVWDMRARVMRGELTSKLVQEIECCHPPDEMWSYLLTFGVIMLLLFNIFFMFSTRRVGEDYNASLRDRPDCA